MLPLWVTASRLNLSDVSRSKMDSRLLMTVKAALLALALTLALPSFGQYPGSLYYPKVEGGDVTFLLKADGASEVKVFGDFLPGVNEYGVGGSVPMTRNSEGVWEYKAEGLSPDFYFYYFSVDGVMTLDPHNLKLVCNYSEWYNSFLIKGEGSANLDYADCGRGTLTTLWYDSPGYGGKRRLNVYLPYGYTPEKEYPVIYMLPGGGDDEDTWVDMGRLPQIMDNMIGKGLAKEMIVVMVNSMPNQFAGPHIMDPIPGKKSHFEMMGSPEGASGGAFASDLVDTVIPLIEKCYSVKKDKASRAICGVSMGGVYEMYILSHWPTLFGNIAFMGSGVNGAPQAADLSVAPIVKEGYSLMWIGAGKDDIALRSAKGLMDALDRAGSPYVYYDSGGFHNWHSWRLDLQQLLPLLFR